MITKFLINSSSKNLSSFSLNQFNKQYSSLINKEFNYFQYLNKLIQLNHFNKLIKLNQMAPNNKINETIQTSNDDIICKFGVLTDAQYANIANRAAWYDENKTRYYKDALTHLKKAFNNWSEMKQKPTFVLQLGDLIDGLNTEEDGCNSLDALEQTFKIFEEYSEIPTFHAVGNHELYNFSRSDIALLFRESLIKRGKLNPDLVHLQLDFHDLSDENMLLYYSFIPQKGIKVIALDCFDISIIGHDQNNVKYKSAEEILRKHNHSNFNLWDFDTHLEGLNKRFQTQNGGLSDNQLMWLRNELEESKRKNEKVICFGHTCVHPDSCDASCLLYNYDQVIEIFNEYKNQVICYLSGHAHTTGYTVDAKSGIHYLVLHGIIETSPDQDAYSTITIKKDKLIVEGRGVEQSLILPINNENKINNEINESNDEINESNDKFNEYEEQLPSSIVEVSV